MKTSFLRDKISKKSLCLVYVQTSALKIFDESGLEPTLDILLSVFQL